NGTDALQIALMALDLKPGDEVITPSYTFIATVEVVALLGLTPVFVDVDADTFTMNIDSVKNAITEKTKAIIPVHLYGQCVHMEPLAEKRGTVANHGQKVRYYNEIVGCNSRLDAIQAAVLRVKLPHLDEYCDARRAVADYYDNAFKDHPNIVTPYRAPYCHHV